MIDLQNILEKYWETIKEELNIKEISEFKENIKVTKIFKPNGAKLSNKFGKDTGKIIQHGKQWNIKILEWNQIQVFDNEWWERVLEQWDYEVVYEWLTWDDMVADQDLIIKLDLNITPELLKEWMAREFSRFLNQMRKDADFSVDAKVEMTFETIDDYMKNVILEHQEFLTNEALLKNVKNSTPVGDLISEFEYEWKVVKFGLKK